MTRRHSGGKDPRRRGVVITATLLGLLALGFYIAFILVTTVASN